MHSCYFITEAQTCCSAGAPISSSMDINATGGKSLSLQLNYEYNSVNRLVENNKRLINDPRKRNGHNFLFKLDYNLNQFWAVSAFIPLVIQNRTSFSEIENATGIGDLSLLNQFSFFPSDDYTISWSAGIKLPTGSQYIKDNRGINLSPDMQSGSGTVDFISRIAMVKQHFLVRNLSNLSAFSYRYNTTNNHFGDPEKIAGRKFKFGNESLLTTAFSYSLIANSLFIIPELGIQLRHTSPNKEESITASNSGGFWINLPLAIQIKPNDKLSIRAFSEIPIKQYLKGLQITTNYKIGIQLRYQLFFDKPEVIFLQ